MSNLHKRIELLSNIAIIIVAILLGLVVVNRYLLPSSPKSETAANRGIKPGTKLTITDVDWSKADRTLLIVLSTNCRYCTESVPFYQRLARENMGHDEVRVTAVFPQSIAEAQKYLADHAISVDDVRQSTPDATYVKATPTLIMVDRAGSVIESWIGKLPTEKEADVMKRFLEDTDD